MERYSARTVDELGRLTLHSDLRKRLGLETGDKVSLMLVDTILILRRAQGCAEGESQSGCLCCPVSELGMIELPIEIRQKLSWKENAQVALYHTDNIIILKSAG